MAKTKLEEIKFNENQVRDILERASDSEARQGQMTPYSELVLIGTEAGIPEEYIRQEVEKYTTPYVVNPNTNEVGELELTMSNLPARLRWADNGGKIGATLGLISYVFTRDIQTFLTVPLLSISGGWILGSLYNHVRKS